MITETRTVQERLREHSKYIGCDPRSARLLTEAADRIDALEKALGDYDNAFCSFNPEDKQSRLVMRRAVIAARAALSPPSDNEVKS